MNFRAEEIVSIIVFKRYPIPPVFVHVQTTVADNHPLKVQSSTLDDPVRIFYYFFSKSRQVSSRIGLATDPESVLGKLWKLFEPQFQRIVVVLSSL